MLGISERRVRLYIEMKRLPAVRAEVLAGEGGARSSFAQKPARPSRGRAFAPLQSLSRLLASQQGGALLGGFLHQQAHLRMRGFEVDGDSVLPQRL